MELQPHNPNELHTHSPKTNIQDAFKKFQKEKFYQLKLNKYLKHLQVDRKSPNFKKELRQKFIQTAHQYIGVPYDRKYHQPGQPLYDAPLFLDCCALVRQCIFDLRQEFCYTLGKWNQAYQFDLLPNDQLTEADLQPGDLIFYSAVYYNPRLKPFPHNMVHVEIYLGQGKSIGSRWQKGTIQVFDSYKFDSTMYHDIVYHYRSIDSWLQGKFESHCPEHKYLDQRANEWLSDKFSVFADPTLDDLPPVPKEKIQTRKVFVGKGNNSRLVSQYFSQRDNYALMNEKEQFSPHFFFKWVQSAGEIDFYSFQEGEQLANHIPNITILATKLELLRTIKEHEAELLQQQKIMKPAMWSFLPKTYRLNVMSDEIEFLNDQSSGIWIYKPRNLNQGRGIRLIADIQQFKREFVQSKRFYLGEFTLSNMIYFKPEIDPTNTENKSPDSKYDQLSQDGLIQHYIRPLLLRKRKFDIRCFLLLNSNPFLAAFHPGYLRLTIEEYHEERMEAQDNLMVHLTNNCFQNKHKLYKDKKEDTIGRWTLIEEEIGTQATQMLRHQIKEILVTVVAAAKRKIVRKRGTYELLGCDILIGSDLRPYLLEVNTNPAMFTDTAVQKEMLPKLMNNTLDVVLQLYEDQHSSKTVADLQSHEFELLYDEQSKWVYGAGQKPLESSSCEINGLEHVFPL